MEEGKDRKNTCPQISPIWKKMKNPKDSNSKTQSTSNMRKTTPRHIITKLLKNCKWKGILIIHGHFWTIRSYISLGILSFELYVITVNYLLTLSIVVIYCPWDTPCLFVCLFVLIYFLNWRIRALQNCVVSLLLLNIFSSHFTVPLPKTASALFHSNVSI